jgi:hypothetical protein
VLPKPTKGFGKPCVQQTPRPSRYGGAATQQVLVGAFFPLVLVAFADAIMHTQHTSAGDSSGIDETPLLRNQIRRMTRLHNRLARAEQVTVETVHPAEKASAGSASGLAPYTSTLKRRTASVPDDSRAQAQRERIEWFRAKTEELAMLREKTEPFRPGQLVYCANDNGRLVRGTVLSVGRAKNRLMVGRVRMHIEGPGIKVKEFRLTALFPLGGCNGGLEAELEQFVSFGAEQLELRGAAGVSNPTSARHVDEDADERAGRGKGSTALSWLTKRHAPAVDEILTYLEEQRLRVMQMPFRQHAFDFDINKLGLARRGLKYSLIEAETRLLRFCEVKRNKNLPKGIRV